LHEPPSTPSEGPSENGGAHFTGTARAQAEGLWNDAKQRAESTLTAKQHAAASGVEDFARVLRQAAHELSSERKTAAARIAESAADGLEQLSGTLRSKDLNSLVRDVESYARTHPAVFLGAAAAAGFLAVRFLKSGSELARPVERRVRAVGAPEGIAERRRFH
jgi:hypothetical protein